MQHLSKEATTQPLMGHALEAYRKTQSVGSTSPNSGPLTPLCLNRAFLPVMAATFLSSVWPHKEVLASHFYKQGKLLSLEALNASLELHALLVCACAQKQHFLMSHGTSNTWSRPINTLNTLCSRKHLISALYSSLFGDLSAHSSSSSEVWEWDLDIPLSEANCDSCALLSTKPP